MNDAEKLRKEGYGRKRVKVRCWNMVSCGWEGRRIWGPKMFDKPCPRCKSSKDGITTLFSPPYIAKE
jgi:hypothetical protein